MSTNIVIFAELSKKQLGMIERNEVPIEVPYGTTLAKRPIGKRGLVFTCATHKAAKELTFGLSNDAINWQIQEGSLEDEKKGT